jgi:myo-inositol 2-dehydrogenase / D-chiro-inositol 1-dehydrogenase
VELALAGAGWVAAVHGIAAGVLDGVSISHVASRTPERAKEFATGLGAAACTYDELPAGADAVVICSPPALHAAHARHAIAAGAAVLVEKPLCTTLADADALVEAASEGARIAYAENLVHAPVVRAAVEQARLIGTLTHLRVRAVQPRPDWGDFLTEGWGGGVLFDLGVHPLAVALLMAAPARPVEVTAALEGADDHPVDEHAEVRLRFDSGLVAHVTASWRGDDLPLWDAEAASPGGVVRAELLPRALLERDGEPVRLPAVPEGVPPQLEQLGYLPQLASFARDVAEDRHPAVGAAFGRSLLEVACAAYGSAGTGRPEALPFRGSRQMTPLQLWRRDG